MRRGQLGRFAAGLGSGYLHTLVALFIGPSLTPVRAVDRAAADTGLAGVAPCRH